MTDTEIQRCRRCRHFLVAKVGGWVSTKDHTAYCSTKGTEMAPHDADVDAPMVLVETPSY